MGIAFVIAAHDTAILGAKQWVLRATALSDAGKEGRFGGKEDGD